MPVDLLLNILLHHNCRVNCEESPLDGGEVDDMEGDGKENRLN